MCGSARGRGVRSRKRLRVRATELLIRRGLRGFEALDAQVEVDPLLLVSGIEGLRKFAEGLRKSARAPKGAGGEKRGHLGAAGPGGGKLVDRPVVAIAERVPATERRQGL